ncbi:MAG: hypothetical protein ACEQSX_00455 [Baekduiaceae bacterium]
MSVEAMSWVFAESEAKGNARLVLLAISNHIAADTAEGWCYVATVLQGARCSYDTYRRAVQDLIASGELARSVNEGTGGRFTRGDSKPNLWAMPRFGESRGLQSAGAVVHSPPQSPRPAAPAKSAPRVVLDEPSVEQTSLVGLTSDLPRVVDPVAVVWETWQTSTGHLRAVLDSKRRSRITKALAQFDLDDVLAAVQGWRESPWHRGENPTETVYDGIELLLRDAAHIERFRDLWLDAVALPDTAARDADLAGTAAAPCATCDGKTWVYDEATGNADPCPVCRAGIIP